MQIYKAVGILLFFLILFGAGSISAQKWLDLDHGLVCETGTSGLGYCFDINQETQQLHLAGAFYHDFHCDTLRSVVYWDGESWLAFPRSNGATYRSMKIYQGAVYSNSLTTFWSNGTAQWGSCLIRLNEADEWETLSDLTNDIAVFRMREIDGYLYGACSLSNFNEIPGSLLFKWDGQTMEAPIDTIPESISQCYDVCEYQNRLFVGGRFSFHDSNAYNFGEVVNHRVKGYGLPEQSSVWSLEEHEGLLYIGGAFPPGHFGLDEWTTLLVFDGSTLTPHPFQQNGVPRKLISYNGYLYIVGHFTEFNGEPAFGVARMNQFGYEILNTDSLFSPTGLPTHNQGNMINDAIILNDTLYITGNFGRIGPYENLNCVAKLNMALSASETPLPLDGVSLYPNPSSGDAYLEAPEFFTHDALVRIFNSGGQFIRIEPWPAYTRRKKLDRQSLSGGVYLVELLADDQQRTLRWVVID